MAYIAHEWTDGELITAERLNELEKGAAEGGPEGQKGEKGEKGDPGPKGEPGAEGKSVKSIALTTNGEGKVTGGTLTFSDDSTSPIDVSVSQ